MKKIPLTIFFAIHFSGYGQNHKISLTGTRLALSVYAVNIDSVIDGRSNKSNIGFVQKGMGNKKVNANFAQPFEEEFLGFVQSNTPFGPKLPLVTLRVNYLNISEHTTFSSEKAYVKLGVDFLVKKDTAYLMLLSSESSIESGGMDVTKKHPINIAKALKECFEQLNAVDMNNIDFEELKALTDDVLIADEGFELNKYQLLKEKPKRGIYKTFQEFVDNDPSIIDFDLEAEQRVQKAWTGTFSPTLKYPSSNKKIKKIWGFSDGYSRNIFHQMDYFEITISDEGVFFDGYGEIDNSGAVVASVMGGAIGAGIASAAIISSAKKQKVKYTIHLDQGGAITH